MSNFKKKQPDTDETDEMKEMKAKVMKKKAKKKPKDANFMAAMMAAKMKKGR